jgi:hypothetical protein
MDLASVQRLTCSLPALSRLHSHTHNSIPNHAAVIFSSGRLVPLGPAADTARQRRHLRQIVLAPALTTSSERAEVRVHRDRAGICCVRAWHYS